MAQQFDLIVIGGGPAGISGANDGGAFWQAGRARRKTSRGRRRRDQHRHHPEQDLARNSAGPFRLRSRKLFGVDLSLRREATVADFMHHMKLSPRRSAGAREEQMRTFNVETFHGAASFVDPHTVRVAPDTICCAARKFSSPPAHHRCARRSFLSSIPACMTPMKSSRSACCRKPWQSLAPAWSARNMPALSPRSASRCI